MVFCVQGNLGKSGKFWFISVPLLEIYTQGNSERSVLKNTGEAIELIAGKRSFRVKVEKSECGSIIISSQDGATLANLVIQRSTHVNQLGRNFVCYAQRKNKLSPDEILNVLDKANKKAKFVLSLVR